METTTENPIFIPTLVPSRRPNEAPSFRPTTQQALPQTSFQNLILGPTPQVTAQLGKQELPTPATLQCKHVKYIQRTHIQRIERNKSEDWIMNKFVSPICSHNVFVLTRFFPPNHFPLVPCVV